MYDLLLFFFFHADNCNLFCRYRQPIELIKTRSIKLGSESFLTRNDLASRTRISVTQFPCIVRSQRVIRVIQIHRFSPPLITSSLFFFPPDVPPTTIHRLFFFSLSLCLLNDNSIFGRFEMSFGR